jgi:predicted nucleic acid-binding protein
MVNLYCDTSALVKVFVAEENSDSMQKLYSEVEQIWVSQLTWVEMQSAFARRLRSGESSAEVIQKATQEIQFEWASFKVLMPIPVVTQYAGILCHTFQLRAYDAVQLATARIAEQQSGQSITFACFDNKLNEAAKTLGLQTL